MKTKAKAELAQAINRQAHLLAAKSFATIRLSLEEQARTMLRGGQSLEETLQAIKLAGLHNVEGET